MINVRRVGAVRSLEMAVNTKAASSVGMVGGIVAIVTVRGMEIVGIVGMVDIGAIRAV